MDNPTAVYMFVLAKLTGKQRIMIERIRLVIADDHPIVRKGFAHMFSSQDDIVIVATATNGKELLSAAREHQPHVIITDLKMPQMDGREACTRLQAEFPHIGVIAFSMYDDEELIRQMRVCGIKGYLLKGVCEDEVYRAVRVVYAGGEYYCTSIRSRINRLFASGSLGEGEGEKKESFSERELQIMQLICHERTSKEIADKLQMNTRTVESCKLKLQEKMSVNGTVGIALYAIKNWLVY